MRTRVDLCPIKIEATECELRIWNINLCFGGTLRLISAYRPPADDFADGLLASSTEPSGCPLADRIFAGKKLLRKSLRHNYAAKHFVVPSVNQRPLRKERAGFKNNQR